MMFPPSFSGCGWYLPVSVGVQALHCNSGRWHSSHLCNHDKTCIHNCKCMLLDRYLQVLHISFTTSSHLQRHQLRLLFLFLDFIILTLLTFHKGAILIICIRSKYNSIRSFVTNRKNNVNLFYFAEGDIYFKALWNTACKASKYYSCYFGKGGNTHPYSTCPRDCSIPCHGSSDLQWKTHLYPTRR